MALAAGFPGERMGFHGNNKSVSELRRALEAGVGRIIVDSFDEIDRLTALARRNHQKAQCPRTRHGRCRGAHPRVHRDRPRGPEVRVLAGRRRGVRGCRQDPGRGCAQPSGAALAHRLADLRYQRLRGRGAPGPRAAGSDPRRARRRAGRPRPGRRLRHRLHHPGRPQHPPATWRNGSTRSVESECDTANLRKPHLSIEPGRAIVGPAVPHPVRGRHGQGRRRHPDLRERRRRE